MKTSKRNIQNAMSKFNKLSAGKPVQSKYGMRHRPEPKEKEKDHGIHS